MSRPVRLGIVGLGHMGKFHLQRARQSPQVEVVALYDTDLVQKTALQVEGLPVVDSYEELLKKVEAVIISSPTQTHAAYAEAALRAQRHLLVEKPVVCRPEELEKLIRLQEEVGVVTVVGHTERFNPAFQPVWKHRREVGQYVFERVAPWTPRGSDASVVLDLLIHDLDLFWALTGGRIADLRVTAYRSRTSEADTVQVWIDLVDGRGASFLCSRTAPVRRRRLIAHGPQYWLEADLLQRTVQGWQLSNEGEPAPLSLTVSNYDALTAELEHFLQCIRENSTSFLSLEHVFPVMEWTWRVEALAAHKLAFVG